MTSERSSDESSPATHSATAVSTEVSSVIVVVMPPIIADACQRKDLAGDARKDLLLTPVTT